MDLKTLEIPAGTDVMEDGRPFFFEGGDTGILLQHGFTGTTSSLKPMGEYLAAKGLTVLGPRLPGHGTSTEDMGRWSGADWIRTVETALDELSGMCKKVFMSGLSMGGTLTLYMAENHGERLSGIIPISAAVSKLAPGVQNYALKAVPLLKRIMKTFPGPGNDLKDPSVTEVAYEKMSTEALHELVKLAAGVKADIAKVTVPIKIIAATDDHVIPVENSRFIFEHVSSDDKELVMLENCYHVATLDYERERVFEETLEFVSRLA